MMIDVTNAAVTAKTFPLPAWHVIAMVTVTSIMGVLALSAAVEGYFKTHIPMWQRIVMAVGVFCLIVPETLTDIVSLVVAGAMLLLNWRMAVRTKPAQMESAP